MRQVSRAVLSVLALSSCKVMGPYREPAATEPHAELEVIITVPAKPKKNEGVWLDVRSGIQQVEELRRIPRSEGDRIMSAEAYPVERAPRWTASLRIPAERETWRFNAHIDGLETFTHDGKESSLRWVRETCDVSLGLDARSGHRYRFDYVYESSNRCTLTCQQSDGTPCDR
jgi:hypothetical protein